MIHINDWEEIDQPAKKCSQCEEWFHLHEGFEYFDIEPTAQVCSWRCAELFTADYNAGEADHIYDQMKERRTE